MKKNNVYSEEDKKWMTGGEEGSLPKRVIPSEIYVLASDKIFVFESNALGIHHRDATRVAYFEGLQRQSYAIPTMESLTNTMAAVKKIIAFAWEHTELKFLVTPIGCGIAGYFPEEIAPMFTEAVLLENVYLPVCFWKVLQEINH